MKFEDLNWFGVENYLEQDDRLMLVLGACEQHGYLSLLTDVKIPWKLAEKASQETGVLVAPAVNYGISPYFLAYPGTLSLRTSTLLDLVEDLVRSAHAQGFRRFLVLNGHGGNAPAKGRLAELVNHLANTRFLWHDWWQSESVRMLARQHGLEPNHANWLEAFAFTRVGDIPEGHKTPPESRGIINAERTRQVYGDGVYGGDYLAGDEIMEALFKAALGDVLQLLKFE